MKNSIHSTRQEFDVDSLTLGFAEHLRMTLGDDQHSATNTWLSPTPSAIKSSTNG